MARRGQTRDASRIRREMAETDRIEQAIDALLDGGSDQIPPADNRPATG